MPNPIYKLDTCNNCKRFRPLLDKWCLDCRMMHFLTNVWTQTENSRAARYACLYRIVDLLTNPIQQLYDLQLFRPKKESK